MNDTRCSNERSMSGRWSLVRCSRRATGDDGLCNVCRAAKKRGEKQSQEAQERYDHETALRRAKDTIYQKALSVAHDDSMDGEGGLNEAGWKALSELRDAYRVYRALAGYEER